MEGIRKEFNVIVKRLEKAEDQLNDIIPILNDLSMNAVKKQDPIHIKLQNLLNESMLISPDYTTRIPDPEIKDMLKGKETDLSQIFDNNFNCYADNDPRDASILAMTKDKFIEVVSKLLRRD